MADLEPPPRESSVPSPSTKRPARRVRILVVDDEPVIGAVLRRIFKGGAHEVTVVQGGRAALAMIDAGAEFDVIFCDVVMPDLTGTEVYETLRARHPRLLDRFVFITGGALQESARRLLASASTTVLHKPFDLGAVRDAVRRIVAAAR